MKTLKEILIAEATEHDFKMMLEEKNPTSWLKSVSAFANGFGGSLYFGVSDDGTAIGLSDARYTADKISEFIVARIEPSLLYTLESMLVENAEILRLVIKSGASTPYYVKSGDNRTAYYRSGNESVKATDRILTELILKGSNLTHDATSSEFKFGDHSFTMLNSAHAKKTGASLNLPEDLISFGLMKNNGILTRAGALFADYCPVYNSRVFCTRWSGLKMGAGVIDALDDAEFSGNVLRLVNNGVDFMRKHNRVMWNKTGLTREEMPDYPAEALTESLTNAIIHRSYILPGTEVHIDIYDDRIEITSPGGMYDNKPIQELDLTSVPSTRRNPILADVFQRIEYAERRGTGIKKIMAGYEGTARQPKFYSDETSFRTTLFNLNYGTELEKYANGVVNGRNGANVDKNVSDNVRVNVQDNVHVNVYVNKRDSRRLKLLEILQNNNAVKLDSLASMLGVSTKTIQRDLDALISKERIVRVGPDKTGYWKVLGKDGGTDE